MLALLGLLASGQVVLAEDTQLPTAPRIDHLYDRLGAPEHNTVDPAAAWCVENLVVELDTLTLTFEEGEFFPRAAVDGQVFGAVFLGKGRWRSESEDEWDREQLKRMIRKHTLDARFDQALIQFSPQHLASFQAGASPASEDEALAERARTLWAEQRPRRNQPFVDFDLRLARYLVDGIDRLDRLIVEAPLEGVAVGKESKIESPSWFQYGVWGSGREPIRLYRYHVHDRQPDEEASPHSPYRYRYENLMTRQPAEQRGSPLRWEPFRDSDSGQDLQRIEGAFQLRVVDEETLLLDGDVTVTLASTLGWASVVELSLTKGTAERPVTLQAVTDVDGTPLPFLFRQGKLLVQFPEPIAEGEVRQIRVRYVDVTANRLKGANLPRNPLAIGQTAFSLTGGHAWFPRNRWDRRDAHTWLMQFTVPEGLDAAVSGTEVAREVSEDGVRLTIAEPIPAYGPAAVIGPYTLVEHGAGDGAGPSIRVFAFERYVDTADDIATLVSTLVRFYEQLYGVPFPYAELDVAQAPVGVGFAMATPGLILADGSTYVDKELLRDLYGFTNAMRVSGLLPHEVAHTWWAQVVQMQTRHDEWMMEACAEYSAALFQEAAGGEAAYQAQVTHWKGDRRGNDVTVTMPLFWVGTHSDGGRRSSTVYGRGPLLLHELRHAYGVDTVVRALQTLAQRFAGGRASTLDLLDLFEEITGESLDVFFHRYILRNVQLGYVPLDERGR